MSNKIETVVEQGYIPQISEKERILKARAVALAKQPEDNKVNDEYIEVVEFKLSHENYGIESSYVREVYPLKDYTTLPGTPPFVLGIMNVRGQIVSVINLKKLFNLPEKGLGPKKIF